MNTSFSALSRTEIWSQPESDELHLRTYLLADYLARQSRSWRITSRNLVEATSFSNVTIRRFMRQHPHDAKAHDLGLERNPVGRHVAVRGN